MRPSLRAAVVVLLAVPACALDGDLRMHNPSRSKHFCARFLDPSYRPITDLTVTLVNR
jgi:hypothetical protein